jgi:predicted transcriptional regulator
VDAELTAISSMSRLSSLIPGDSTLSAATVLRGETDETRLQWLRRKAFVESILSQTAYDLSDSAALIRFALTAGALALTPEELANIPPATDPIGARLQQEQLGIPSLLNVGNLIGEGLKFLTGKGGAGQNTNELWTAIPTETEARVLNILWSSNMVTTSGVYAQLDSVAITFKDLQTVMEQMVARGLVEREQVSPKNEFTILGAIAIEMSRKNAKNREFAYRPRASRKMFYTFLDALAFSRHSSLKSEDVALRDHLSKLLMVVAPRDGSR